MTLLIFLLAMLAAVRTWRLMALDSIGEPFRRAFDGAMVRLNPVEGRVAEEVSRATFRSRLRWYRHKVANFLSAGMHCPHCVGFWIALAWVGSALAWGDETAWQLVAGALAASYVLAHLAENFDLVGDESDSEMLAFMTQHGPNVDPEEPPAWMQ